MLTSYHVVVRGLLPEFGYHSMCIEIGSENIAKNEHCLVTATLAGFMYGILLKWEGFRKKESS